MTRVCYTSLNAFFGFLAAVLVVLLVLIVGANADARPSVKFADLRKGGAVAAPTTTTPTPTNALYHYNRLIAALDAVPTAAVDPLAAASNLTGKVIGDVTVTSGLVAAFAIVTGLLLVVFGHYLFKPVLFIAGFYFFAVVTYSILQNISYKTDHAFSEILYLAVCIIVGLLGGGLAV
ncbi:hypothetical protein HK100_005355 [Physocladia obscura]|uniref:TM7S3/TM198-like domain-containing protein n=1 Tax=Physocladia obscura TaxID=109957 RepID=A0AAD5XDB0_9FUNG|nr:hypothetical protein HK100_005355 [Physocladia obscura]